MRWRFDGEIAGVGSVGGTRIVVGRWRHSPLGDFADVMVERSSGERTLLAPSEEVAAFVGVTYRFDRVRIVDVHVTDVPGSPESVRPGGRSAGWSIEAGPLRCRLGFGGRTLLGRLLGAVPGPLATSTGWAAAVDPVARVILRGVRTRGRTGNRREWYAARDVRSIVELDADWDGADLGPLAPVDPPVRFGFGSTPRRPSVVRLVTTVDVPDLPTDDSTR